MIHLALPVFFLLLTPAKAQTVTPLRAVISPDQNQAVFTVSNSGQRTHSIQISWLHLTAEESGSYRSSTIAERRATSAAPFLSLSPAEFQLSPGEAANIIVSLRDDIALPDPNERRSHLLVESSIVESLRHPVSANLGLDITTAVSVPVILRTDQPETPEVTIEETQLRRLSDGSLSLDILLRRNGEHSVYGALKAESVSRPNRPSQIIAQLENISLYPESDRRSVSINMGLVSLPAGQFDVTFEGRGEYSGKVFARRIFSVEPTQNSRSRLPSQPARESPPYSVTTQ